MTVENGKEVAFYPDKDEDEPEDHTAEDAEYDWKRDHLKPGRGEYPVYDEESDEVYKP